MTKQLKSWGLPAGVTMGTITGVVILLWNTLAQPIVDATVKTALTPVRQDIYEIKVLTYKMAGDSLVAEMKKEIEFTNPKRHN